jgi:hypothetical protein
MPNDDGLPTGQVPDGQLSTGNIPPPDEGFIQTLAKVPNYPRRWRESNRIYEWDSLHGELEVYNRRGKHLGSADPRTGAMIKPAVPGRTINV